jgi:hypothetical protein
LGLYWRGKEEEDGMWRNKTQAKKRNNYKQ